MLMVKQLPLSGVYNYIIKIIHQSRIKKNPDINVRVFCLDWFKIISVLVKGLIEN